MMTITTTTSASRLAVAMCPRAPESGSSFPPALRSGLSESAPARHRPTAGLGMVTTPRWTGDARAAARRGGPAVGGMPVPTLQKIGSAVARVHRSPDPRTGRACTSPNR
jgi:hypothetical protein